MMYTVISPGEPGNPSAMYRVVDANDWILFTSGAVRHLDVKHEATTSAGAYAKALELNGE